MTEIGSHVPPLQKKLDKHDFSTAPFNNDDKVKLHASGLGNAPMQDEVCVTLGNCIPLPLCVDVNNGETKLLMVLTMGHGWMVHYATLQTVWRSHSYSEKFDVIYQFPEDVHSFLFDMPSGVGTDNELLVWSSGQPSLNAPPGIRIKFKPPALLENPLYAIPYKNKSRLALTQLLSVCLERY